MTLVQASDAALRRLDAATRASARHAVIVLRDEDKAAARAQFRTPLIFSVHECIMAGMSLAPRPSIFLPLLPVLATSSTYLSSLGNLPSGTLLLCQTPPSTSIEPSRPFSACTAMALYVPRGCMAAPGPIQTAVLGAALPMARETRTICAERSVSFSAQAGVRSLSSRLHHFTRP